MTHSSSKITVVANHTMTKIPAIEEILWYQEIQYWQVAEAENNDECSNPHTKQKLQQWSNNGCSHGLFQGLENIQYRAPQREENGKFATNFGERFGSPLNQSKYQRPRGTGKHIWLWIFSITSWRVKTQATVSDRNEMSEDKNSRQQSQRNQRYKKKSELLLGFTKNSQKK